MCEAQCSLSLPWDEEHPECSRRSNSLSSELVVQAHRAPAFRTEGVPVLYSTQGEGKHVIQIEWPEAMNGRRQPLRRTSRDLPLHRGAYFTLGPL